ncbi:MAG TPA: OsmC family protein [Polyangiaceae bacterium]|nr:OsmC family protein [Polyangiaceae bacterium]
MRRIPRRTDQPRGHGGGGTAPEPFALFLASLATCAGYYVLAFCQARGIPMEGVSVDMEYEKEATGLLSRVVLRVDLPPTFPEKYVEAVRRAAESCKVKATLAHPPAITVRSERHGTSRGTSYA